MCRERQEHKDLVGSVAFVLELEKVNVFYKFEKKKCAIVAFVGDLRNSGT